MPPSIRAGPRGRNNGIFSVFGVKMSASTSTLQCQFLVETTRDKYFVLSRKKIAYQARRVLRVRGSYFDDNLSGFKLVVHT